MIRQIRNSVFIKILWGMMSLYLLNISIDPADPSPEYIPEDLKINDQESIVEIIVEEMLGFENALVEYDDQDTENHLQKTTIKIVLFVRNIVQASITQLVVTAPKQRFPGFNTYITSGFHQLFTPPPKI